MRNSPSGLLFSPKDLLAYAEGDFVAWMERANHEGVAPFPYDPDDPELALLKESGNEHEARVLAQEKQSGRRVETLGLRDSVENTLAAMKQGADTIYQACLRRDDIQGYADFLRRVPVKTKLGDHGYEPWDTKLARTVRPYHVVQLCAYCDMLEEMQGVLPARFGFVLGDGREEHLRTLDYIYYYRELRDRFRRFHAEWRADGMPDPAEDRTHGRWTLAAGMILAGRDHLGQVANISRSQIKRLEAAGVKTVEALAADPPRPTTIAPAIYTRLVRQARLQRASKGKDRPAFEVPVPDVDAKPSGLQLLPPRSEGDVFFDMEGFPHVEGGLEYLFGAVVRVPTGWEFHDWWAHDTDAERVAFEGFIDWAYARWKRDPAMHIYHYAAYETTAVKRLMGKFGTREQEVDDLLRNHVFVDLYAVVRQGVTIGTPGYSLKEIERLWRPERLGSVTTAGGSVVAYDEWRESGEPGDWRRSPKLAAIRKYNDDDCISTGELADWLWKQQRESKIGYVAPEFRVEETEERPEHPNIKLVEQLEAMGGEGTPPRTLAGLLEYHRREAKPTWWQLFAWQAMTDAELVEEDGPLGLLTRTDAPPLPVKRSTAWEYAFPVQETTIEEGAGVRVAATLESATVERLDLRAGRIWLKRGPGKEEPGPVVSILPFDLIGTGVIEDAIRAYAGAVTTSGWPATGVTALLHKRSPSGGKKGASLRRTGEEVVSAAIRLARTLDGEVLCLQGPPGAGKTYTAAHLIAALLGDGKRVAVTGQAHKVIDKVLDDTAALLEEGKGAPPVLKFGGEPQVEEDVGFVRAKDKEVYAALGAGGGLLVGGSAWFFSRPEVAGAFDVLLIDEAGQYPLANAVGAGQCARSLVLVGDQMQLAQPRKGTHPGESGSSALEYYLAGHATVPADVGILLDKTWRMHPSICDFISAAFYEGRLQGVRDLERQQLAPAEGGNRVQASHGIVTIDVPHEGNDSSSMEEVGAVEALAQELVGREWTDSKNVRRRLTEADILVVAPFNDQVNRLEAALGDAFRVGTVDRFQGQEAPVVIVSLASSTLEDAPRGAEFLLSPNRLNVAISRAQSLAIVVASPGLTRTRPTSVRQIALVNRLDWIRGLRP